MIPITYLPATGLVLMAIWIATRLYSGLPSPWLIAFLCGLALQLFLLGARYGYAVEAVLKVQHLTGVLIPLLGYLAFTNPSISPRVMVHGLPVLGIALVLVFAIDLVDAVLAMITLGYAIGLIMILRRNGDGVFSWASLRYAPTLRYGLFATVAVMVLSGVTDAVVAVDFLASGGHRTDEIAASASLGDVTLLAAGLVLFLRYGGTRHPASGSSEDDALVEKLSSEMNRSELFRDPDLTLSRLARHLGLPAREISKAVNRSTGLNISQFINNMRISAVCKMLTTTDVSVTTAMLEAGFYTKSNFNREFRRVTGQTPTDWRSGIRSNSTAATQ